MDKKTIYLFNDEKLGVLLGLLKEKEKFLNGDIFTEKWILIAQTNILTDKHDVPYSYLKPKFISKLSITDFNKQHIQTLKTLNDLNNSKSHLLSWLQIFQMAAICQHHKDYSVSFIENTIKQLDEFYQIKLAKDLF